MTGPRITTWEDWKARLACASRLAPLAQEEGTARGLWNLAPHSGSLCRDALALCLPFLNDSPIRDREAWLKTLYTHLTDRLFPDEALGHGYIPLTPGEEQYLALLELLLSPREEPFDPLLDLIPLEEAQITGSRVEEAYRRFLQAAARGHILALLRLGRELMPFDPACHTIGVHNVALHTAKLAKEAGLPVDLPLVRAAAFCHDVGKFGCRGADAERIPYLHYYYTWQWFQAHGLEELGYISANHSTWDLEFENLPIESLLLVYADFRVRGLRDETGREHVKIYSLSDAFQLVLSKLADVTPEKRRRYETVYHKLRDFEAFLHAKGVPTELGSDQLQPAAETDASLLSLEKALHALRNMAFSNSIHLMALLSRDDSFDSLLKEARGVKNQQSIRTYLHLLEEYNTYMSAAGKHKTLELLYELLMHPEGDVRRKAGEIMGQILANSGPRYRKERPVSAARDVMTPTMMALLEESVTLWEQYILRCLRPDRRVSAKHAGRISNSLKTICRSLFAHCSGEDIQALLEPLLRRLWESQGTERFVLADALYPIPWTRLPQEMLPPTIHALGRMLSDGEGPLQLAALRCLEQIHRQLPAAAGAVEALVQDLALPPGDCAPAIEEMRRRISGRPMAALSQARISELYLSDLKNAVHWSVKLVQIDLLKDHALQTPESAFHTAMHLSNLLSVSEHLPVREHAGACLLELCPVLTVAQRNEIVIDLLRELESGQEQISRFIPPYAGQILCMLPEKEFQEALTLLEGLVQGTSIRSARAALFTLGEVLHALSEDPLAERRVLSGLMTGISHYKDTIHRTALSVLCREIFGSERLSLKRRHDCFVLLHKKLLTLLSEPRAERLTFFSQAAMLNHLYRFMVRCEVEADGFSFPPRKPAAFFPGTFDPFSVGHKRIVEEIRAFGFEVYLAVDEFSWSKRTLAKRIRRQIVSMSAADQWDTYLFPDDIPVSLANPQDLARLRGLLGEQALYLVVGNDVIHNASAYRQETAGSARDFDHIVFYRFWDHGQEAEEEAALRAVLRGKLLLLSLPPFFESVSSTRIRDSVDQNLDISMLVTPVVQTFIYESGFYLRAPVRKKVLRRQDLFFRSFRGPSQGSAEAMNRLLQKSAAPLGVELRLRPETLLGWTAGRTLRTAELYSALGTLEGASFVRRHASGLILLVDSVCPQCPPEQEPMVCRMLLNELLARSLESDHTYALCRCPEPEGPLDYALEQLGFCPIPGQPDLRYVDMRAPLVILQDLLLRIKEPHRDSEAVKEAVARLRPRLRRAMTRLFPGRLVLCFDSELLGQALMERVQRLNGVQASSGGQLGSYMCVPYGEILADEVVPNTVTKTLYVEKVLRPGAKDFAVVEQPGCSSLQTQIRTLKSFRRPVILVDDLLHKGYRIEKLGRLLREEGLHPHRLIVAMMSGYGRDLMQVQGLPVECEYFIPNLHHWVTESLLYPFLGGDSNARQETRTRLPRSVNLILPYCYPRYLKDAAEQEIWNLSRTALENARALLQTLEQEHQRSFHTALTIRTLGEVLEHPRLPDRGQCIEYDLDQPPSAYLRNDLKQLRNICAREEPYDTV